ncbi:MAG: phosphotransferase [Oscillochloridaceae bacterium umkhey_bin13]
MPPAAFTHLNHYVPPVADGLSDAWRRVLARLGDDTATVVQIVGLRPVAVRLHAQTERHILIRITTLNEHLILRVAPEDDLAAHVFFLRTAGGQGLPVPRLIQRDLARTMVPFAYTLEAYVPGVGADQLTETHLLRGAGRQAGRALRRMHRVRAPGAGRPNPNGRWPSQGWLAALNRIGNYLAPPPTDAVLFDETIQARIACVLSDPRLYMSVPQLIHGDFGPHAVCCTAGSHVNLEALVEPGICVGGDGLFDLACGLCAIYPEPWREGLLDGYTSAGPLSDEEQIRLPLLRLLTSYWLACRRYSLGLPHEAARHEALERLATL